MTVKQKNTAHVWWMRLWETANRYGGVATAGQVATQTGFSRSTCQKYLSLLVKYKSAEAIKRKHWNGQKMTVYVPLEAE